MGTIENDHQKKLTQDWLKEFYISVAKLEVLYKKEKNIMHKIQINALQSQIETFKKELENYETLKRGKLGNEDHLK